jgi:hypothetical protein
MNKPREDKTVHERSMQGRVTCMGIAQIHSLVLMSGAFELNKISGRHVDETSDGFP